MILAYLRSHDVLIHRDVSSGVRVLVEGSIPSLNLTDLNTTLQAVTYQANEHPGYEPQYVTPWVCSTRCLKIYSASVERCRDDDTIPTTVDTRRHCEIVLRVCNNLLQPEM